MKKNIQKALFFCIVSLGLAPLSTAMDFQEERGRTQKRKSFKDQLQEQEAYLEFYDIYAEHRNEESWEIKCDISVMNRESYKSNALCENIETHDVYGENTNEESRERKWEMPVKNREEPYIFYALPENIETHDVYGEHTNEESQERKWEMPVKNGESYRFNTISESKDSNSPSSSSSPPSTPERISLDISPKKSISQPNSPVKKKSLPRRCQSFVKTLTQTK